MKEVKPLFVARKYELEHRVTFFKIKLVGLLGLSVLRCREQKKYGGARNSSAKIGWFIETLVERRKPNVYGEKTI